MKIYKVFLLSALSFIALEEITYAEKIPVDIYVEGPHLTTILPHYKNPNFVISIGPVLAGNTFEIDGDELKNLPNNKKLLKKGAELAVTTKSNQRLVPPSKYAINANKEYTTSPQLCGINGDKILAYNDAGKPLKSLTFITEMHAIVESGIYKGDCTVTAEYNE